MSNKNIPVFPQFKKIHSDDLNEIKPIIEQFPTYSDFGPTSMIAWGTHNDFQVSSLGGNLVIRFTDYLSGKPFLSMLGKNNIDESLTKLIKFSKSNKWGEKLHLIPQSVVNEVQSKENFIIEEDIDNFDYILSVIYHAELVGGKNEERRYRISRFHQEHGEHVQIKELDINAPEVRLQILDCFDEWTASKQKNPDYYLAEKRALSALLHLGDKLDLLCCGIYYDKTMIGFSIYEIIHDNHCTVHFEKGNKTYRGINYVIRHEVAKRLHKMGVKYINYEQDLGIEGLRKSKMKLHPVKFLKKYTVSLK